MKLRNLFMAGVLLSGFAAADSLPRSTVDQLLRAAERDRIGRVVDVNWDDPATWKVKADRNGTLYEYKYRDVTLKQYKSERKKDRPLKGRLSIRQAIALARKRFKGTVTEAELETKDGRVVWKVELHTGNSKSKVTMDANTGRPIKTSNKVYH